MNRFFIFFAILFCLALPRSIFAQTGHEMKGVQIALSVEDVQHSIAHPVPLENIQPFLTAAVIWEALDWKDQAGHLRIRFSKDGTNWADWMDLELDAHSTFVAPTYRSQLLFIDREMAYYQLDLHGNSVDQVQLKSLRVDLFSPGHTKKAGTSITERDFCPCPLPAFQDRNDWCPTGTCPIVGAPVLTDVTHLIVHHSAGTNLASDWAAVVRAIWNDHVNSNGWDDIGYNWLIDPNGIVYQGRANNVRGAHFCGYNDATMGVCVLGNFTNILPTVSAQNTLKELLAWKCCESDIDPLDFSFHNSSGLNLFNISGHRDGCATACPGDTFYPTLPDLREFVHSYLVDDCGAVPAPNPLIAVVVDGNDVQLTWEDNTDNEIGFLLERSSSGIYGFTTIDALPPNTETYLDVNLQDADYHYRIRSLGAADTSAYSNIAGASIFTTGTVTINDAAMLRVFPNPFTDLLTIELLSEGPGNFQLELADLLGQTPVLRQEISGNSLSLNLESLPAGVYRLSVTDSDGTTFSQKIIKQ